MKKLSKSGRTKFEIDNLDHGFLLEAIDNYEKVINETEFHERSIMTKGFVLDRVESLKKTFKVGD